jgi:VanZ family protein
VNKINMKKAVTYWFVTIGYMGIIFYLSSLSWQNIPAIPQNADKIIHTVIYTILAFLLYHSLIESGFRRNVLIIAFLIATLYGISDEIHQFFVPGRFASVGDVLADSFGALLGSLSASHFKNREYLSFN